MTEIDNWGEPTDAAKQKDALIRELVAALAVIKRQWPYGVSEIGNALNEALAKAKAAGYEP